MPNCSTPRDPNRGSRYAGRVARPANLQPRARRVRQRPAAEFERRDDLRRPRAADAGDPGEVVGRAARQAVQAAVRRQQRVGDAQRVAAPRAAAEHQRDQLVVAERRRPVARAASRAADRPATGLSSYQLFATLLTPRRADSPGVPSDARR